MPQGKFSVMAEGTPPVDHPAQQCYHCGDPCATTNIQVEDKHFCCQGCKLVYEMLNEHELCTYYDLEANPGISLKSRREEGAFAYLDHAEIEASLLSFKDEATAKVSFYLPQIHCSSCIWLLENLYRLREGISGSRVDFLKKDIHLTYDPQLLSLRELVTLLANLGYEPEINLNDLQGQKPRRNNRHFYYKLGVAGFAFGNIMLMSFPEYLGLDETQFPEFRQFFGYLNILLALPVIFYSATVFFRSAWVGLRERFLNIDVPISLGIVVLFGRSVFEIVTQTGAGYLDSLAGLVFFLLVGRWFQNKTYDRLSFDRDYKSYFPISTTRKEAGQESSVPITMLSAGDTIVVRNQELIPADALLLSDEAQIDYSFVTGEARPVRKKAGDLIYAGGRQVGPAIELTLVKNVSQSYLTELWNHEAMQEDRSSKLTQFIDLIGRRFTLAVLAIGTIAGIFWWATDSMGMAVNVFTAVLIVACPCALALSSPIILGNTMRVLGRLGFYVKNTLVIERMTTLSHVVFDKTGTLTYKNTDNKVQVDGDLKAYERDLVATLARQSTHPMSRAIEQVLKTDIDLPVQSFQEHTGQGLAGEVDGHRIHIGNWALIDAAGSNLQPKDTKGTWIMIDGQLKARVSMPQRYRSGLDEVLAGLREHGGLSLISGDNDREAEALAELMPADSTMHFDQSPQNKLTYIADLQDQGERVMMVGDGLNDAGALRRSDVGVAVSENIDTFSPACDAIMDARRFGQFDDILRYARNSMRLVRGGLVLSLLYNVVGLTIAVQGLLSPVIAAILMPLSSVTIVVYGLLTTEISGRRLQERG